jgi:hypothetical protein
MRCNSCILLPTPASDPGPSHRRIGRIGLARKLGGSPVRVQGLQESLGGMFHGLPGMLVTGLVIFLAVMRRGSFMSVRSEVMQLRGSLVSGFHIVAAFLS